MLEAFARLFSRRIWEHAKILIMGASLCPAERTVAAVLQVVGLSGEKHFQIVTVFSVVRSVASQSQARCHRSLTQERQKDGYLCVYVQQEFGE
jgi:hypothetical protein